VVRGDVDEPWTLDSAGMHTQLGINGFGRTGRAMFRAAHEQGADLQCSSVFDSGLTLVTGGIQLKTVAWYDNEWGYSSRLVERVLAPQAA
jgi:glyceraldehyde-3-phosphate dehydrogenase/erythrose-4-phosphate dehydrogenase